MLQMKKEDLSFIGDMLAGHTVSLQEICDVNNIPFDETFEFLSLCGDPSDVLMVLSAVYTLENIYKNAGTIDDVWKKNLAKAGILCSTISFRTEFSREDVNTILLIASEHGICLVLPRIGLSEILGTVARASGHPLDDCCKTGACCNLMEFVAHATLGPMFHTKVSE
tara:strand:+ start:3808 stop:4308 length:501 start_codon:yes stop_codon:yes gene_type:complete